MSYSFSFRAKTKQEVVQQVTAQYNDVVAKQPYHEKDRKVAQQALEEALSIITIPEAHELQVSVTGTIGWELGKGPDSKITSVGLNMTMYVTPNTSV